MRLNVLVVLMLVPAVALGHLCEPSGKLAAPRDDVRHLHPFLRPL